MEHTQAGINTIVQGIEKRHAICEDTNAYRLFNGFLEGVPGLILDRYGSALIIFDHSNTTALSGLIDGITQWALENIKGLTAVLLKQRQQQDDRLKNGVLIAGESLPESIVEYGVHYALDLQMNQDTSFYLDMRLLRRWLFANMRGKRVLNTFAYSGSLGVAAGAGGAAQVVQTDLSQRFLNVARKSWQLNDLDADRCQVISGDFFRVTGRMRHEERLFDCVILDPPFFSDTDAGRVDLEAGTARLVNKVRPLVAHGGYLVVVNNALFLSGGALMAELEKLCESDYLCFEDIIPVPGDVASCPETIATKPPVDPAPFNHPTKIVLLRVFRKDERT